MLKIISDGKRQFTNSKKVNKDLLQGPQLDPSIPTVGKDGITVAVRYFSS
jgi:hypothetical protein